MSEVRATVRLQFHREFTLDHAVPLVAYFNQLGISHIYASPLLKARSGSMHCYDVIDPTCINPELGGEEALSRLIAELRKYKMGLIVDIVSNHMAVGGSDNPWWLNVLQWGLKSPYAHFFDIQWSSPDPLLKGQLLLPFLPDAYGEVLASGKITLHFDPHEAIFYTLHANHRFPLYPPSYSDILRYTENESLCDLALFFEALEQAPNVWSMSKALHEKLRKLANDPAIMASINNAISNYDVTLQKDNNGTEIAENENHTKNSHAGDIHPDWQSNKNLIRLHELLEKQHYRLASWRTAADDINWRRFFDINELGAIRVERADVFEAVHAKIFELIERGLIDGLRIDHVDGLANPRSYCRKLRRRVNQLIAKNSKKHFPIFVEKILAHNETLSPSWNVDGSTGYEFMNQVSLLQHDKIGEPVLRKLWSETSGRTDNFKNEVIEAKQLVLSSSLAGDVEAVAQNLLLIARADITTRDLTLGAIRRALIELVANFSVYRTYANACGRSQQDQEYFNEAMVGARTTLSETDWPLLEYLDRWLGGQSLYSLPPDSIRKLRKKVIARFQQLTSPAAAKAVEDTACYRSAILLSRNDVGFDPQYFSASVAEFHQNNIRRVTTLPNNLLTTATHDHKRGEDTRARIAVISECADWFSEKVQHWQHLAHPLKTELADGVAPSPGDELILYQTLLGSWPLELIQKEITPKENQPAEDKQELMQAYLKRLLTWQEKAIREAKLRSSWSTPNADYETACKNFLTHLLTHDAAQELRNDIATAVKTIAPAGALNSLSQTLLRMTAPGIPDLYQGTEFWDFSLVDPDNRRPVDFDARIAALSASQNIAELIREWETGRIKQWLIARILALRNIHAPLFAYGDYIELVVEGKQAEHIVAFIRHYQGQYIIVIAPRLVSALLADSCTPHVEPITWGDTQIVIPPVLYDVTFQDGLAANCINASQGRIALHKVLEYFPVGMLFSKQSNNSIN